MNQKIIFAIHLTTIILLSSCFGQNMIKEDEEITFYPAYAYQNENDLIFTLHGHVYEPEQNSISRNIFMGGLRRVLGISKEDFANQFFQERIRLFLVDNERGKAISVKFGQESYLLDESLSNGHFTTSFSFPQEKARQLFTGKYLRYESLLSVKDKRTFSGKVEWISPIGISVISDIDDTIKQSNVLDKKNLFRNTFMKDFQAVKGMPEVYQSWKKQGACFHYVSGSPWQLYLPLSQFIKELFPEGSLHLKYFRIKDSSSLQFIFGDQVTHKKSSIEQIFQDFPQRKFILVGDSGEQDAEIYRDIAQKYPEQVLAIGIRDLGNRNKEHYEKLFEKIAPIPWKLFTQAEEIEDFFEEKHKGKNVKACQK